MKRQVKLFSLLLGVYLTLVVALFLGTALAASSFASTFLYNNKHHRLDQAAASTVEIARKSDISDYNEMLRLQDVIDAAGNVAGARIYLIEAQRLSSVTAFKGSSERGIDAWLLQDAKTLLAKREVYRRDIYSAQLTDRISFVGKPIIQNGEVVAVVLVFSPLSDVQDALFAVRIFIWTITICACLIGFVAVWIISRRIVRPLKALQAAAETIADGNYADEIVQPGGTLETIHLTESFNTMKRRVQEADEKRRQLIADVSHELRTPLMTIRGFIMAVLDGTAEGEMAEKSLKRAFAETERMGRLTEGLLRLARLQAGSEQYKPEIIDIKQAIDEITESFAMEFQTKDMRVEVDVADGLLAYADMDHFIRIMTNLISNAVNYSENKSRIIIRGLAETNTAVIQVEDSGVGIPAEELPMIFEKFHRVDRSRSQQKPGTGLGLSIVQELVRLNKGSIEVASELKKGSCFTVRLPQQEVEHEK